MTDRLRGPYFTLGSIADADGAATCQLTYGGWIRVLRDAGLTVVDLIEPRPEPRQTSGYYQFRPADWATRWPCEALWVASKPQG